MAKDKKSSKAGRNSGSNSAKAYKAGSRRYFNKLKKVKRHINRCVDPNAGRWFIDANKILAMEYVRGSAAVKKLHEGALWPFLRGWCRITPTSCTATSLHLIRVGAWWIGSSIAGPRSSSSSC